MNTVSKFGPLRTLVVLAASVSRAVFERAATVTRSSTPARLRAAASATGIVIATFSAIASPLALAAEATQPVAPAIPIAHSALLTIDAMQAGDSLSLRIRHVPNQLPIDSKDVTVTVDGKSEAVTAAPDGAFVLGTKDLAGDGERTLDVIVAHDGIREILTGKLTLPKPSSSAADMWRDHKQMAWWVLNIGIILFAAILFSRRSSS